MSFSARFGFIRLFFLCIAIIIAGRLFQLHILHKDFLMAQGNARALHVVSTPSYRGLITDRRGEPLAVSAPVDAIWVNPKKFSITKSQLTKLSTLLQMPVVQLQAKMDAHGGRAFLYLKRGLTPELAERVRALKINGLYIQREYRRYYPAGADTAQLIGFTNIDDEGQSGLELYFDKELRPTPGKNRVLEDRIGHWIQSFENIQIGHSGEDVALSIDARLQALALRELEKALIEYKAVAATAVVIDVQTSEVLAMVTAPSFNPNNRQARSGSATRLRAITDPIEPGSTVKAFTIAAALESGLYTSKSIIDTTPGSYQLGKYVIHDISKMGRITLREVLTKSSNVAICKIALSLKPQDIVSMFTRMNLGDDPILGLPGESSGQLNHVPKDIYAHASFGFGYGLLVTPLQLAHAYTILAHHGVDRPLSILRVDPSQLEPGEEVLSPAIADEVVDLLASVIDNGGGRRANIPGYRTAGKTGTVRLMGPHGYDDQRHTVVFAGMTPVKNPRIVAVISVEDPKVSIHLGGLIAAPIYASIVGGALHILNVPPDSPTD